MPQAPTPFLDVPSLLDMSRQRASGLRFWHLVGIFLLVVTVSAYFNTYGEQAAKLVSFVSGLAMVVLVGVLIFIMWWTVRRARDEQAKVEAIDELIRLRRWQDAGAALQDLLGRPTRMPPVRVQGLIFLTTVLARYGRFEDALLVQDFLFEHVQMDPGTMHGLRLARAMALLRQDHLTDADRAIGELRNQVSRAGRLRGTAEGVDSFGESESPQAMSGGLALVEMYRDIKTGHPAEAVELFKESLPALRDQLGMRVADAHALVARAYDLLDQPVEAQSHFSKATILAPAVELFRRYPETETLGNKYQATPGPREVAA